MSMSSTCSCFPKNVNANTALTDEEKYKNRTENREKDERLFSEPSTAQQVT